MPDINDYGRFEGFHMEEPKKKEEPQERMPEPVQYRKNPFEFDTFSGGPIGGIDVTSA
jgi:hypothetical protein